MTTQRTICAFTGGRAEFSLSRPILERLEAMEETRLTLVVTGGHLSPRQGETWREIEQAGFTPARRIEILQAADTSLATATAMGLGVMRFAEALESLSADLVLLLGDRFETLAAATAAAVCRLPVAHVHGGEITRGAMDDAFRHAITKLSHLHFASTASHRRRIIQMGESPDRVFHVGAPGVEAALATPLLDRRAVAEALRLDEGRPYFLVTWHPATLGGVCASDRGRLDDEVAVAELVALLEALARFPDHAAVFTGANADPGGDAVNRTLAQAERADAARMRVFLSLGQRRYLSAAAHAAAVVGNSSSGVIEIPSLGVPVVNIGDRQAGRDCSPAVLHCPARAPAIAAALGEALSPARRALCRAAPNPCHKPGTAAAIAEILRTFPLRDLVRKSFFDIPVGEWP